RIRRLSMRARRSLASTHRTTYRSASANTRIETIVRPSHNRDTSSYLSPTETVIREPMPTAKVRTIRPASSLGRAVARARYRRFQIAARANTGTVRLISTRWLTTIRDGTGRTIAWTTNAVVT